MYILYSVIIFSKIIIFQQIIIKVYLKSHMPAIKKQVNFKVTSMISLILWKRYSGDHPFPQVITIPTFKQHNSEIYLLQNFLESESALTAGENQMIHFQINAKNFGSLFFSVCLKMHSINQATQCFCLHILGLL